MSKERLHKLTSDLTGQVFGRRTVLSFEEYRSSPGRRFSQRTAYWLVQCWCGRIDSVRGDSLRRCSQCKACANNKYISQDKDRFIQTYYYNRMKYAANKRNIVFDIKIEYLQRLIEKQNFRCALSGVTLTPIKTVKKSSHNCSVDRIDSDKGYIKGNVQWVETKINIAKHIQTQEEFVEMCKRVVETNKE